MRRWFIALAVLIIAILGSFAACRSVRHRLVAHFTPEYEPPVATDFQPTYDGADAKRPRIPIVLRRVTSGFVQPTDVAFVPGQPDLMLLLEKSGKLHWIEVKEDPRSGVVLELPVLFVSEQGLLGIAFHPKFEENGRFYLNYNIEEGGDEITRISEWKVPGDFRATKPEMTRVILDVVQPYQNHNGGQILFGPDGNMYIGLGDGGWMNDPHEHGQNKETLLGSMIRIDVDRADGGKQYGIPAENPFVNDEGHLPEIWAVGLRNPWRYSFTEDGRLIAGDVGQDTWEEITFVPKGANLGWNIKEGSHCFDRETCRSDALLDPIHDYPREEGGSVTGGFIYLWKEFPELAGKYVFGDFLSGRIWALDVPERSDQRTGSVYTLGRWPMLISTFARDPAGRVYVADYPSGSVYRIDPPPEDPR